MKPEYLHNLKIDPLSENTVEDDFSIIYEFYRPKLVVIVNSYIPSQEDAEEIIHDVFIKLWEKWDTLQITSNFTGYIYS